MDAGLTAVRVFPAACGGSRRGRRRTQCAGAFVALMAFPVAAVAQSAAESGSVATWPGFRGPAGIPVSDDERLPVRWSTTENVEWSVDVPGSGWSSPIVAGDTQSS